jgi:hyaluronoglucosaminidase
VKAVWAALLLAIPAGAAETRRGVLEGFYGRPWSWTARRSMVRWMGKTGLDLFVLAPKDDPVNRDRWRDPPKREYFEGLSALLETARESGVSVAWGMQPFDADFDSLDEAEAAAAKIEAVAALGIEEILIAFDDLEPDLRHFAFANRIRKRLRRNPGPWPRLTFVPAVYWGDGSGGPYWKRLRRELHADFRVAWTGPKILSPTVTGAQARAFSAAAGRTVVMGDNFPVQDRLIDAGRLFLGPVAGREPDAVPPHAAWVANGSPLAEASKAGLFTVAEFLSEKEKYDPCASMRRSAHRLGGRRAAKRLGRFFRENAVSWLADGEDPGCGPRLADALRAYGPGRGADAALKRLRETARSASRLPRDLRFRPALRRELDPWIRKLAAEARAAAASLELLEGAGSPRREALLLRRYRIEKEAADNNPALVANQEISRFLIRVDAARRGESFGDTVPLVERLRAYARERTAAGPLSAALARYERLAPHELVPWFAVFSRGAAAARERWAGRGRPLSRWRRRARFLPLLATRSLLENYFGEAEGAWTQTARPSRVPFALKGWLLWRCWTEPESFPARLWGALSRERRTRDPSELKRLFNELASLPKTLRARRGAGLPVELLPWIDRIGDYGRLGLASIRLSELARQGIRIHWAELRDWDRLRRRTASSNGLELAVETLRHLDAFDRWAAMPAGKRPRRLPFHYPANPADIL